MTGPSNVGAGAWSASLIVILGFMTASAATLWAFCHLEDDSRARTLALMLTARVSLVLFGVTFAASSLNAVSRKPWTKWLMRHRRSWGLAFAISHTIHLGLILWGVSRTEITLGLNNIPGVITYALIAAMVVTSNDTLRRGLGNARWRALHTVGMYTIATVFTLAYAKRVPGQPAYAIALGFMCALFALRGYARLRGRRRRRA